MQTPTSVFIPDEHHMVLEDYLLIAKRRQDTSFPLFKLQLSLVHELATMDRTISKLKDVIPDEPFLDIAESGELPDEPPTLTDAQQKLLINRKNRQALRDIGDGMAWRLFGYDRAVINVTSGKPAGSSTLSDGMDAELHELGHIYNIREGIGLLNCITNVLQIGDITVRFDGDVFEFR